MISDMKLQRTVAVFIFDEVEVLDFAGPFEVFSVSGRDATPTPFRVFTCAEQLASVSARNGLVVMPTFGFTDCPPADVLVIPGGWGTRALMERQPVLDWIRSMAAQAEIVLSVCTGSLLLARAGLLTGLKATTHHGAMDRLAAEAPGTALVPDARFVDNGRIITAAGISAGMDASLHVVTRLLGIDVARDTAAYMEYEWKVSPGPSEVQAGKV